MATKDKKELTTIKFTGPSFEDHGLELDVLNELLQYKKILIETAKELWRKNNPDRERIPKGFENSIRIKFYELCEGSTAVPLYREPEEQVSQMTFDFFPEDELEQAVEMLENSIELTQEDKPLPDDFPRNIIQLFENLGKSLGEKDSIQLKAPKRARQAEFTPGVKAQLINMVDRTYEDVVDISGEVRLADLDGYNFTIRLENGDKIPGKFETEQEPIITAALKDHDTVKLKFKGMGQFSQKDAVLKRVTKVNEVEIIPNDTNNYDEKARPFWEMVSDVGMQITEKEWEKIPADLSKDLDHYLYGSPRSEQ